MLTWKIQSILRLSIEDRAGVDVPCTQIVRGHLLLMSSCLSPLFSLERSRFISKVTFKMGTIFVFILQMKRPVI